MREAACWSALSRSVSARVWTLCFAACGPAPHQASEALSPGPAPQMTDVLRRYPDAAAACVESVAAIPEEVRVPAHAGGDWFSCTVN